jgi:hypothetical protein
MNFKSFIEKKKLEENSLYKNPQERQNIVSDKSAVADIFVYNFLGILGLINGITRAPHMAKLQTHFKKEKQVQLQNISDDNHDMSIAVKLAKEAGFFKNDFTVTNITKFLAKLKLGQISEVDSSIIAGWLENMTPEFFRSISDPKIRAEVVQFTRDKGVNVDVSRIALAAKRKANKATYSGEFKDLAKIVKVDEKLIGSNAPITAIISKGTNTPTATTATSVAAPKAKVAVAAPVAPPPPVPKPTTVATKIDLNNTYSENTINAIRYLTLAGTSYAAVAEDNLKLSLGTAKNRDKTPTWNADEVKIIIEKIRDIGSFAHRMISLNVPDVKIAMHDLSNKMRESGIFENAQYLEAAFKIINWPSQQLETNYGFPFVKALVMYLAGNTGSASSFSNPKDLRTVLDYIANSNLGNKSNYTAAAFLKNMSYEQLLSSSYTYNNISQDPTKQVIALFLSAKMQMEGDSLETIVDSGWRAKDFIGEIFQYFEDLKDEKLEGFSMKEGFSRELERIARSPIDSPQSLEAIGKAVQRNALQVIRGDKVPPIMFSILDRAYKQDLLDNGLADSRFEKRDFEIRFKKFLLDRWGITYADLQKRFPNDKSIVKLKIEAEGTDNVSAEELSDYAEYSAYQTIRSYRRYHGTPNAGMTFEEASKTPGFSSQVVASYKGLYNKSQKDTSSLAKALSMSMDRHHENFDSAQTFKGMMHLFQGFEKEGTLGLLRVAKKHNFKTFFDPRIYKDTSRRAEKEEFVSILTSVMNDAVGTDVEDYFSDILETMPGMVVGRIRSNLIGFNRLVEEVNKGVIQPFGNIDDKRLRTMLMMNDINASALVAGETPRRKKNEKWTDYFKRAKTELEKSTGGKVLGAEKVTLVPNADVKATTKTYNSSFRAGKHGDTYVKILKTFNSNFKFPEFDEFRKTNFGDGTITPAFHGTGGIAASMILRYGFKVIKSSDPSVAGRMLGDGIYFSNKIDKALQYVSNGGYDRGLGTKGYILELDNTLGKSGSNYRAMGLGNDHIRSPEWCVYEPKKQLAIIKVHEVEFANSERVNKYLAEDTDDRLSFKDFMTESRLLKMKNNVASFVFRDGNIPILDRSGNIDYVDFEDAINQKMIPASMIDYSRYGPVVVFDNAKKNEGFDLRYADLMNGNTYKTYVENFNREVLNKR